MLFASDFTVHRAFLILIAVVRSRLRRAARTNSDVFHPRDDVWNEPDVVDVTDRLCDLAEALCNARLIDEVRILRRLVLRCIFGDPLFFRQWRGYDEVPDLIVLCRLPAKPR